MNELNSCIWKNTLGKISAKNQAVTTKGRKQYKKEKRKKNPSELCERLHFSSRLETIIMRAMEKMGGSEYVYKSPVTTWQFSDVIAAAARNCSHGSPHWDPWIFHRSCMRQGHDSCKLSVPNAWIQTLWFPKNTHDMREEKLGGGLKKRWRKEKRKPWYTV